MSNLPVLVMMGLLLLPAIYGCDNYSDSQAMRTLEQKAYRSIYENVPPGGKVVAVNIPQTMEFSHTELEDMEKRDIKFDSFHTTDPAQFYLGDVYFIDYRPLQFKRRDNMFQDRQYEVEMEKNIDAGGYFIKTYNNIKGVKFNKGKERFYRLKAGEKLTGFVLPNKNWRKRLIISCLNFPETWDGIFPMAVEVVGYTRMALVREAKDKHGVTSFVGELIFGGGLNKVEVINRSEDLDILISGVYLEDPKIEPPPPPEAFSGVEQIRQLYKNEEQSLRFKAEDLGEWKRWQAGLRAKLREILAISAEECPLEGKLLGVEDKGDYILERIVYQSEPGVSVPAYLLLPKGAKFPRPAVVALHGHGAGRDEIIGKVDRLRKSDFGLQLVKRGYVVLAPDARGFGERATGDQEEKEAMDILLFGKTMMGMRVWDAMRAIDYLETRTEVDSQRLGMVGLSMGGAVTLFTTVLDERVKIAVVSGYFGTFKSFYLDFHESAPCMIIPGILRYAELYDIAGLIAPRPLAIEAGEEDPMIPIEAARESFDKLKRIYQFVGAEDKLIMDQFKGEHQFNGEKSYPWLDKNLRP